MIIDIDKKFIEERNIVLPQLPSIAKIFLKGIKFISIPKVKIINITENNFQLDTQVNPIAMDILKPVILTIFDKFVDAKKEEVYATINMLKPELELKKGILFIHIDSKNIENESFIGLDKSILYKIHEHKNITIKLDADILK